jgi:DNA-binding CsgD family transcriptional regulator
MRGSRGAISIIEAAYADESREASWLDGLVAAAMPVLAESFGACAYVYDARRAPVCVGTFVQRDAPPELESVSRAAVGSMDEDYVDRSWRSLSCAAASEVADLTAIEGARPLVALGIRDCLVINAYDVSGIGVWLGGPLPRVARLAPGDRRAWTRVAAHIATAFRLRCRSGASRSPENAAAVLSPDGRIEHAQGPAKLAAMRQALREAVTAMERARGPLRRRDPQEAVGRWRTLVEAQWTLLDHFERHGKRYVVAVENAPMAAGPEALTDRERQVVATAAAGRTNKLIAYELGIRAATVRVLLSRAGRRLGVRTRAELLALYRAHVRAARAYDAE